MLRCKVNQLNKLLIHFDILLNQKIPKLISIFFEITRLNCEEGIEQLEKKNEGYKEDLS